MLNPLHYRLQQYIFSTYHEKALFNEASLTSNIKLLTYHVTTKRRTVKKSTFKSMRQSIHYFFNLFLKGCHMHTHIFRATTLSMFLMPFITSTAATEFSQKFRAQDPYFYAAIASAAYKHKTRDAQAHLDHKLGVGKVKVLQTVMYKQSLYGNTNMILVKDDKNRLHVGFEGSSDIGNWVHNVKLAFKSVDKGVLRGMHKVIYNWQRWQPGCTLASVVGHSQGGMYASQVVRKFYKHYTQPQRTKSGKIDRSKRQGRATAITFNAYKPIKAPYQFHFATKNERGATLFSSKGRYIPLKERSESTTHHSMKHVRRALRGKKWEDFKKYNEYIR